MSQGFLRAADVTRYRRATTHNTGHDGPVFDPKICPYCTGYPASVVESPSQRKWPNPLQHGIEEPIRRCSSSGLRIGYAFGTASRKVLLVPGDASIDGVHLMLGLNQTVTLAGIADQNGLDAHVLERDVVLLS